MKRGYSRLLIHEHVIPETAAYWEATALDMVMLTLMSAQERTRTAWYNLIETRAGLMINKIWSGGKGSQSLIECELPYTVQVELVTSYSPLPIVDLYEDSSNEEPFSRINLDVDSTMDGSCHAGI